MFRIIVAIINGAIRLLNKVPGVSLSTIAVGETAGFSKDIKQAQNVQIVQNTTIETKSSEEDIDRALDRKNDELMREIRRNTI